MDDLILVEILEAEAERLSPTGRELWTAVESAAELNPPGSPEFMAALPDLGRKISDLPEADSRTMRRLVKLYPERKNANSLEEALERVEEPHADDRWFVREWRRRAVIEAAQRKDQQEGRSVDLDMSATDAVQRLAGGT